MRHSFGDDPDALVRDLQGRFPEARLIRGDEDLERLVARVVGVVEAPALARDLPLVAIPCHRVVRNDGAWPGYRWGVERKRALLEREVAS